MTSPLDLLKDPAKLRESINRVQDAAEKLTATGSSGGKMVTVTINGKFEVQDVHLDPICVDNRDVKMLEDLIVSACNDAVMQIYEKMESMPSILFSGEENNEGD